MTPEEIAEFKQAAREAVRRESERSFDPRIILHPNHIAELLALDTEEPRP